MRPSLLLVPILLVFLVLMAILPRSFRSRSGTREILPATALHPPLNNAYTSPSVIVRPIFPGLVDFAETVLNGYPNQIVGVYVEERFAFPVIQQPEDQPAYVSDKDGLVTQFSLPTQYGTVGLLAHNYLSGRLFSDLTIDDQVVLLHGDGTSDIYLVTGLQFFQALSPTNPYSQFIDQADPTRQVISSATLFNKVYTTPNQLVLQTCVDLNGDSSWGRLFVTAKKISTLPILIPAEMVINNN